MQSLPTLAKSALKTMLETGEIREVQHGLAFGNPKGLDILEELDELRRQIEQQQMRTEGLEKRLQRDFLRNEDLWDVVKGHERRFQQNMMAMGDMKRTSQ